MEAVLNNIQTNYSLIGKQSLFKYNLCQLLEHMINKENKYEKKNMIKTSLKNISNENKNNNKSEFKSSVQKKIEDYDDDDDDDDDDEDEKKEAKEGKKKSSQKKIKIEHSLSYENLKFHIKSLKKNKKRKKDLDITDIKYNPNYDYVKKRIITGPAWSKLKPKFDEPKIESFESKKKEYINTEKKFFESSRETLKNSFNSEEFLKSKNKIKNIISIKKKINASKDDIKRNSNKEISLLSRNKSFHKETKTNRNIFNKSSNEFSQNKKGLLIPNFKKMLTRDKLNKLQEKKSYSSIFNPNYNAIQERVISYVKYKNDQKIKKSNPFDNQLITYDIDKLYYNYNNHKLTPSHSFAKGIGRKIGSELPLFMSGIYNKYISSSITEKSLLMNRYIYGNTREKFSSFQNKKSFNKSINSSINIKENKKNNPLKINYQFKYVKKIDKTLRNFYNKNFDSEIINNSNFDHISLKSFPKTPRDSLLSRKEREKYIINYNSINMENWNNKYMKS